MFLDEVLNRISISEIVENAKRLIEIPSVTGEERDVMLYAQDMMEDDGIATRLYGSEERPILTGTINPDAERLLVFNGHLDTVPISDPNAWSMDPYKPEVKDNKLYGRGSCDMKASCGLMIHVMKLLKEMDLNLGIQVQLVPDEERGGGEGTQRLIEEINKGRIRRPDYVVIGEKSNLKIRIAERGIFQFEIKFDGRATHTAYARVEGINAIAKASKGVLALEKPIDKYHEWIGAPVLSVNSIEAGTVPNQVPSSCVIGVDRRLIIGESADSVVSEVTAALNEAGEGDPDWNWSIIAEKDQEGNYLYSTPSYTAPDSVLGEALHASVRKALNSKPELFVEWAGGTDGRFYRYADIQTIGFGPKGEHAHGADEFVYVDSLMDQARVYVALAHELSR
ncbi:MAG: M20 family metallopeptidase [Candidatus Bathyarchaeia archaeon]